MKSYPEKDIIRVWEDKVRLMEGRELFNLYIDNPFCVNQCVYCIHTGSHAGKYAKDFKFYYKHYLPEQIRKFSHIMGERIPDTVYFGGGTSNVLSTSMLVNLFNIIPNFKEIPNKVFEGNPNLMNQSKLDLIKENKFSYVSLGIQSLKDRVLEQNNRRGYNKEFLKKVVSEIQSSGSKVNCDLMAFIGMCRVEKDLDRLEEDFEELFVDISPDIITIYPERHFLRKEQGLSGEKAILELRKRLIKLRDKFNLCATDLIESNNPEDGYYTNYMLYNMSDKEYGKVRVYCSTGPVGNQPHRQNVLGLGGYADHRPWSYHGRDFVYSTLNDNWRPVYLPR